MVIVTWNARDEVLACLESLRSSAPRVPSEVIVVDNDSSDGTASAVRQLAPWARLITNSTNRGLAKGNNQGIRAARGQYIVVSNPDVVHSRGSIDALVDVLERRPRAAFVFARLTDADGSPQTSAGSLPSLKNAFLGRRRQPGARAGRGSDAIWWDSWAHDEETTIGHGGESCFIVRKRSLDDIGLQDEGFPLDWEGVDWCARAWDAGWEVWFCPNAPVVHLGARSVRNAPVRWVVASHRGMYRYFAKRSLFVARPFLAVAIATRALLKFGAVTSGIGFHKKYIRPPSA